MFHPQVQPDLQQAIEVDNVEATENLRDQLAAYCEVLDAGFSKLGVKQQSQIWLQVGPGQCQKAWYTPGALCVLTDRVKQGKQPCQCVCCVYWRAFAHPQVSTQLCQACQAVPGVWEPRADGWSMLLGNACLQGSLLKLYELTAIASAAVGEPEPQLVELLAALAGELAPGSSEHLFWAQQYR